MEVNKSPVYSSQEIWSMMVFDEEFIVKAEEEASKYYAKKKGHQNFFISRSEIRFLKPKGWIDDKIINWRCKEYNNSSLPRFLEEFYCVEARIMNMAITDKNLDTYQKDGTYIGMHPKLGEDGRYFDRKKAANRKWWLLPLCNKSHWFVYAFNLEKTELLVLDSMYDHSFDDLRKSLDIYVGKLIEDMLKIVFPTFDRKGLGFPSRYANVPKQLNTNDCGIYVIKFLEEWTEASELHACNNEELLKIRRRLVLDIALSNYNTKRDELLLKASTLTQRRNNPNRGKK
ncbi:hypothetical protein PIB30_076826 [Stylosanthes scabra]|uniref:Ubiquitin-like protease family profile domain-containing protein n=1 Tax=Stylosanthes scabra TaxID=79078 RepID=A0ABU6RRJ3_9FABA|nr:hypothetical protein [Stylosanthes scabra]